MVCQSTDLYSDYYLSYEETRARQNPRPVVSTKRPVGSVRSSPEKLDMGLPHRDSRRSLRTSVGPPRMFGVGPTSVEGRCPEGVTQRDTTQETYRRTLLLRKSLEMSCLGDCESKFPDGCRQRLRNVATSDEENRYRSRKRRRTEEGV